MSAGTERRAAINAALRNRSIDPADDMSAYQLKELLRVVEIMKGRIRYDGADTATPAVAATYDTDPDQGANGALIFTAGEAAPGVMGNNLRIAYADGATAGSETLTYTVTKAGVITLTIGIQTGVSTATQVKTKLDADTSTTFSCALKTGNSGAGVVVTMAAKALTGGVDPVAQPGAFVITPAA